jgi:hypothetical protein
MYAFSSFSIEAFGVGVTENWRNDVGLYAWHRRRVWRRVSGTSTRRAWYIIIIAGSSWWVRQKSCAGRGKINQYAA